eukprot:4326609-Karenia_brevis.AAC.1
MSDTAALIFQHVTPEDRKNGSTTADIPMLTPYDLDDSSGHGTFILRWDGGDPSSMGSARKASIRDEDAP